MTKMVRKISGLYSPLKTRQMAAHVGSNLQGEQRIHPSSYVVQARVSYPDVTRLLRRRLRKCVSTYLQT